MLLWRIPVALILPLQRQYRRFAPKRAALKEVLRREAAARLLCIVIATANWSRVSDVNFTMHDRLCTTAANLLLLLCCYYCVSTVIASIAATTHRS
jgi:hypothetical protein